MEETKLMAKEQEEISQKATDIERTIRVLSGSIPYTDMPLEELRKERLKKYEEERNEN